MAKIKVACFSWDTVYSRMVVRNQILFVINDALISPQRRQLFLRNAVAQAIHNILSNITSVTSVSVMGN